MWKLYLLKQLLWIPAATILLAGILRGLYHALKKVLGYSNTPLFGAPEKETNLGILPVTILETGIFLVAAGLLMEDVPQFSFLIIGIGGLASLAKTLSRRIPESFPKKMVMILHAVIIGGIASWMVSGVPGEVPGGGLAGGIVGLIEVGYSDNTSARISTHVLSNPGSSATAQNHLSNQKGHSWRNNRSGMGNCLRSPVIFTIPGNI